MMLSSSTYVRSLKFRESNYDVFSFPQKKQLVYYESRKQELKTRPIYDCWFDERLKTEVEKPTRLVYTGSYFVVYYESRKREIKIRLMNEGRCDERLGVICLL